MSGFKNYGDLALYRGFRTRVCHPSLRNARQTDAFDAQGSVLRQPEVTRSHPNTARIDARAQHNAERIGVLKQLRHRPVRRCQRRCAG